MAASGWRGCDIGAITPFDAIAPGARAVLTAALNAILPPRCLSCGVIVAETGALCGPCWEGVQFLTPPMCAQCGYPFELDPQGHSLCGACLARAPAYDRARAVMAYDAGSRDLLLAFKHADRTEAAPALAKWLSRAGAELLEDAEIIAPVPLHRRRLFQRRYNQAALLAHALGRLDIGHGEAVVLPQLLRRVRNTPSQGRLSASGRRRNVAGVFKVAPRLLDRVAGKRILLVDDVLTTGATVEACARVLKRAGASGVDVLTAARVVRARS